MVPAVSRSKRWEASGMIKDLTACFDGLVDPRVTRRCDHRLIDILVIAVSAVMACAESWEDITLYGRSKQALQKTFLTLPNGILARYVQAGLHADRSGCVRGLLPCFLVRSSISQAIRHI